MKGSAIYLAALAAAAAARAQAVTNVDNRANDPELSVIMFTETSCEARGVQVYPYETSLTLQTPRLLEVREFADIEGECEISPSTFYGITSGPGCQDVETSSYAWNIRMEDMREGLGTVEYSFASSCAEPPNRLRRKLWASEDFVHFQGGSLLCNDGDKFVMLVNNMDEVGSPDTYTLVFADKSAQGFSTMSEAHGEVDDYMYCGKSMADTMSAILEKGADRSIMNFGRTFGAVYTEGNPNRNRNPNSPPGTTGEKSPSGGGGGSSTGAIVGSLMAVVGLLAVGFFVVRAKRARSGGEEARKLYGLQRSERDAEMVDQQPYADRPKNYHLTNIDDETVGQMAMVSPESAAKRRKRPTIDPNAPTTADEAHNRNESSSCPKRQGEQGEEGFARDDAR